MNLKVCGYFGVSSLFCTVSINWFFDGMFIFARCLRKRVFRWFDISVANYLRPFATKFIHKVSRNKNPEKGWVKV